ncbi:MAG: antibiotic biosynthesis monooxygenase [Actinobacteria bacterium]|nr:antibiotic biosynthesis monooxygenase [Actinomycetota bacterium]
MEPHPGQVLTIFRSRLRDDGAAAYAEHALRMSELARSMPGYIEHKVFIADDGERVTVVTFADAESHDGWRTHPEHRAAQKAGRDGYYREYSIAVGTVERAHSWVRPEGG